MTRKACEDQLLIDDFKACHVYAWCEMYPRRVKELKKIINIALVRRKRQRGPMSAKLSLARSLDDFG